MSSRSELSIRGPGPKLAQLLESLARPLPGGWRKDIEAEARLQDLGLPVGGTHCFACTGEGDRPAAALWLQSRGDDELHVSNIVPLGKRELSDEEYKLILEDFKLHALQATSDGTSFQAQLIRNGITPDTYLSPEAVRRFKAFCAMANKSSLHENDCQRWYDFIVQLHVEGAELESSLLDQWLAEQGWQMDQRCHLINEYESSRAVLAVYDEERLERCHP